MRSEIQRIQRKSKNTMCMQAQSLGCVQLFVTLWTVVYQAPLSMGFSMDWVAISYCNYSLNSCLYVKNIGEKCEAQGYKPSILCSSPTMFPSPI